MNDYEIEKAMANAEASMNMEGMTVSSTCKDLCRRLLNDEISFNEYLKLVITEVSEK